MPPKEPKPLKAKLPPRPKQNEVQLPERPQDPPNKPTIPNLWPHFTEQNRDQRLASEQDIFDTVSNDTSQIARKAHAPKTADILIGQFALTEKSLEIGADSQPVDEVIIDLRSTLVADQQIIKPSNRFANSGNFIRQFVGYFAQLVSRRSNATADSMIVGIKPPVEPSDFVSDSSKDSPLQEPYDPDESMMNTSSCSQASEEDELTRHYDNYLREIEDYERNLKAWESLRDKRVAKWIQRCERLKSLHETRETQWMKKCERIRMETEAINIASREQWLQKIAEEVDAWQSNCDEIVANWTAGPVADSKSVQNSKNLNLKSLKKRYTDGDTEVFGDIYRMVLEQAFEREKLDDLTFDCR